MKIKRVKDLLTKKESDKHEEREKTYTLKGYLLNSIYNKDILLVLEKIEACNQIIVQIDTLFKNQSIYEIALSIVKLREELKFFIELKDCAVVKMIFDNEKSKTYEAIRMIQGLIRTFFFLFEKEFAIQEFRDKSDNTLSLQGKTLETILDDKSITRDDLIESRTFFSIKALSKQEEFRDILLKDYGVNIDEFSLFEEKVEQIKKILSTIPKDTFLESDETDLILVHDAVSQNVQITKYIGNLGIVFPLKCRLFPCNRTISELL